jgi:tyrosinase
VPIDAELQGRVNALLVPDTEAADVSETLVALPFSPFIPAHARRAAEVTSRLFAAERDGGVEGAIAAAEDAARTESSRGVVKRAVKSFVTHSPAAREVVALPAEVAVESGIALPPDEQDRADAPSLTLPVAEQALDWYREDPFANEHHAHWHDVWQTTGIVMPGGKQLPTQPRQGELFLYMHRQMLARYDTERLIAGLPVAVPFEPPYDEPIAEGYGADRYVTRPAGTRLRMIKPGRGPEQLAERFDKLDQAIKAGHLTVSALPHPGPLDNNQLGAAIEPSELNTGPDTDLDLDENADHTPGPYPNIHGEGHVLTALSVALNGATWAGVMAYVETAIRDPFFYRWHRHIDDQGQRVEEGLGPADLSEAVAPGVHFRDGGASDVLLVPSAQIGHGDFDAFARDRLGGTAFDDPDRLATDTLSTDFTLSRVASPLPTPKGKPMVHESYFQTHLVHDPFGLFLRVEADADTHATIRVFLALTDEVEDRRMWIEVDKFDRQLTKGINLIGRPDALSAVIKRKGVDAPGANPPGDGTDPWCDCGWPYTLLLPSGGTAGTRFTLAAILTDWSKDTLGQPKTCGSMSYCGARESYPDQQPMGYPFHRPFGPAGVLGTLRAMDNVALRELTIRCRREPPA